VSWLDKTAPVSLAFIANQARLPDQAKTTNLGYYDSGVPEGKHDAASKLLSRVGGHLTIMKAVTSVHGSSCAIM
jgi:hypothetical protein